MAEVIDGDILEFPDPNRFRQYRFSGCYRCGLAYVLDEDDCWNQKCENCGLGLMVEVNCELECVDHYTSVGWFYLFSPDYVFHGRHNLRAKQFLG